MDGKTSAGHGCHFIIVTTKQIESRDADSGRFVERIRESHYLRCCSDSITWLLSVRAGIDIETPSSLINGVWESLSDSSTTLNLERSANKRVPIQNSPVTKGNRQLLPQLAAVFQQEVIRVF